MRSYGAITITSVNQLEPGDEIAFKTTGEIFSVKITNIVYASYQLTDENRAYMIEHKLEIPESEFTPLAGSGSSLLFGDFRTTGEGMPWGGHIYLENHVNVAVFSKND